MKIIRHNIEADSGHSSYRMAINNFTDLTHQEFLKKYLFFIRNNERPKHNVRKVDVMIDELPISVDWRQKGIVTSVKNQEQCGSCWAFTAVASLEAQHALATKTLVDLSAQNLMDCSTAEGNMGCNGGLMDDAFEVLISFHVNHLIIAQYLILSIIQLQYVIKNRGIDTEKSYPYEAMNDNCRYKTKNIGATAKNYSDIKAGDEMALTEAIANVGVISVAMDASHESFQFYSSGVYDEPDCSQESLCHSLAVVGYGTLKGKDYYLCKNSWGTEWGDKGYVLMSRNKDNQCGIANVASYPIV
jgi:cathepsin L